MKSTNIAGIWVLKIVGSAARSPVHFQMWKTGGNSQVK